MAAPHGIRLMIVDDHPVFREALAHALAAEPAFCVVAQANSGSDAVALWQRHAPDVTLMDISMRGCDGIATVEQILVTAPAARILMLTSSASQQDVRLALKAGAAGYVTKSIGFMELLAAIRDVHAGGRPIGEAVADRLTASEGGNPLSPRETEVLVLLQNGLSQDEIARQLLIADRTVRVHVAAIKAKLAATSTAHCVTRGFELGILGNSSSMP